MRVEKLLGALAMPAAFSMLLFAGACLAQWTIVESERHYRRDGTLGAPTLTVTTAQRSNGDWVEVTEGGRVPGGTRARILRFADGTMGRVHDAAQVASLIKRTPAFSMEHAGLDPGHSCLATRDGRKARGMTLLGQEILNGHPTAVVRYDGKGVRMMLWRSLEMGYVTLRRTVEWRDPLKLTTLWEATSIVKGVEPNAALFNVPATYKKVKPSESINAVDALNASRRGVRYTPRYTVLPKRLALQDREWESQNTP